MPAITTPFSCWPKDQFLLLVSYFPKLSLEQWSYWAQIITALSVAIALSTYLFQKRRVRLESIARQIHQFRTEIIQLAVEVDELVKKISDTSGKELVSLAPIDEFSIKSLLSTQTLKVLQQQAFWNEAQKLYGKGYGLSVQKLLNALEELAINILAEKVSDSPHLRSIRQSFVIYVEVYAWAMVLTAPYNPDIYPAIKDLYYKWRDQVDRMPLDTVKQKVHDDIEASADRIRNTMSKEEYDKLMGR